MEKIELHEFVSHAKRLDIRKKLVLLLKTIGGSHLYGLNHAHSDVDVYEVHDSLPGKRKRAQQTIVDDTDTIKVSFSRWMMLLYVSHQALDCLYAPAAFTEVDLISDFRHSYHLNTGTVVPAFERVIKSFHDGTVKQQRHAIRLRLMINQIMVNGRYNPHLNPAEKAIVMSLTTAPGDASI